MGCEGMMSTPSFTRPFPSTHSWMESAPANPCCGERPPYLKHDTSLGAFTGEAAAPEEATAEEAAEEAGSGQEGASGMAEGTVWTAESPEAVWAKVCSPSPAPSPYP